MEFSRQEHWSGLPFPFSRDLPKPGIKPRSPALQADSLPSEPPGKPGVGLRVRSYAGTVVGDGEGRHVWQAKVFPVRGKHTPGMKEGRNSRESMGNYQEPGEG